MSFLLPNCFSESSLAKFGIYDPPAESRLPSFIVKDNSNKWMAVVENYYQENMHYYAIDHCVPFPRRENGQEDSRCDGVLVTKDKIAFVEIKSRASKNSEWVEDGVQQLVSSIKYYKTLEDDQRYHTKRGYVCNEQQPQARRGQAGRIEQFAIDTNGYSLFIKHRINLDSPAG